MTNTASLVQPVNIPLPRLLDENLQEKSRLSPIRVSMQLRLSPLSTAEMLLPCHTPAIALRDLVELFDEQGSAGVFRVTAVTEEAGHTRRIDLTHSLCTLQDCMVGNFAFTGTVQDTLAALLNHQHTPMWTAGDVEAPADLTVIYATEYTDLLSAVTLLLSLLPEGYMLDFDQSSFPWRLHLRLLSSEVSCEGRLTRNLHSLRYKADASRLCTRIYPFGAEVETGRISLVPLEGCDYLQSAGDGGQGIISRTFQSDMIFDVPTLREVARLYLERHGQPAATVTAEGLDLCTVTGNPVDSFCLGGICCLALPEPGLTLSMRIIAIDKPDIYGMPGQVTLTLSNRAEYKDEEDELTHLIRQVTASKLLGGAVSEVVDDNRAYGSYPSPVVHYFTVEDWAAVLDVRAALDPDLGVSIRELRVDNTHLPEAAWNGGSFSIMPYLTRDELGQISIGEHKLIIYPSNGHYGEECGVNSTVTMTVIEQKTQA